MHLAVLTWMLRRLVRVLEDFIAYLGNGVIQNQSRCFYYSKPRRVFHKPSPFAILFSQMIVPDLESHTKCRKQIYKSNVLVIDHK